MIKHNVDTTEVEELFGANPYTRFVKKGSQKGEDAYMALGQLESSGRYLVVFYIKKANNKALIISARDMDEKERKLYEQSK
ncbi:MAG: BrnT family toxin [Blastocatellia bacterium]